MRWRKSRPVRVEQMRWFVVRSSEMVKRFYFGMYGVVIENRHGSACLYITDGDYAETFCVVPLMSSRKLQGKAIGLCTGPEYLLGMQLDGSPAVMVDVEHRQVMSRLGAAFGSDSWGHNIYRVWDRGLECKLFDV